MVSIRSSSSSFTQQSNKEEKTYEVDSFSCSSDDENSSVASSESDFTEEVSSSQSSSPTGPLQDMSSLLQQLPKRGLSKHFEGKSQSFTSLSNVRCLEDLAKPEKLYNKKLKACKSYGGLSEINRSLNSCNNKPFSSKKLVSSSRVNSCSSLNAKRMTSTFLSNNRPPMPPHRSTSTTNQTPLFA